MFHVGRRLASCRSPRRAQQPSGASLELLSRAFSSSRISAVLLAPIRSQPSSATAIAASRSRTPPAALSLTCGGARLAHQDQVVVGRAAGP